MVIDKQRNIRDLRQWVCWRSEERDGKRTKVPYSPLTGRKASSTDPGTWGSYAEVVAARKEHGHDGIGFVFTEDGPFCSVDLDRCLDPETDEIEERARDLIEHLRSVPGTAKTTNRTSTSRYSRRILGMALTPDEEHHDDHRAEQLQISAQTSKPQIPAA